MVTRDSDERDTEPATECRALVDSARRDFGKTGLALSGVLFTLASGSAVGAAFVCKSPSGFLSGNLSAHGAPITCSGLTPGYWGTHPTLWPATLQVGTCAAAPCTKSVDWTGGTPFSNFFNCAGGGVIYSTYSMMQVIWLTGNLDPNQ